MGTPAIGNLIREGKTFQIPSVLQTSRGEGMQTLDQALVELVERKMITKETAVDHAVDKKTISAQLGVK